MRGWTHTRGVSSPVYTHIAHKHVKVVRWDTRAHHAIEFLILNAARDTHVDVGEVIIAELARHT